MRKFQMFTLIGILFIGLGLVGALQAGATINFSVQSVLGSGSGGISSARLSPNHIESIGCKNTSQYDLNQPDDSTEVVGICTARNAEGVLSVGQTTDPEMIRAIQSITPASFIIFDSNNEGEITALLVNNSSVNLLPTP